MIMEQQRNRNPYDGLNWQKAIRVQTSTHMHCTAQDIMERYVNAGLELALFSNYYPSTPWYPLAEIKENMFRVSQPSYLKDGKFRFETLDCNALLEQWKDELPEEKRKQLPFKVGKPIFSNIPEDLMEAPNAEHHFFSDCSDYLHVTAPGAAITTSVFDRFDEFGMVSRGGIPNGLRIPWRDAYKLILDSMITRDGGGIVICHPSWSHLPISLIEEMLDYDPRILGIEVYNHDCNGTYSAGSEAIWDAILSTGRQCYGFFVQDHPTTDLKWNGRIVLLTEERTPAASLKAMRLGQFYGIMTNNGLRFEEVKFDGKRIYARTNRTANFQVIAKPGVVADAFTATEISFEVKPEEIDKMVYLRITAVEPGVEKIYSQPVMLK